MGRAGKHLFWGWTSLAVALGPLLLWYIGEGLSATLGCRGFGDGTRCSQYPGASGYLDLMAAAPLIAIFTLIPGLLIGAMYLTSVPMVIVQERRRAPREEE